MGRRDPTADRRRSDGRRRPRWRICLRKGCGREFLARSWNHRYCHDPDCARELARWSARKRQQRRRADVEIREEHREAERRRRKVAREAATALPEVVATVPEESARGHAAKGERICDRPGCFEAPAMALSGESRYCSAECRTAVRRVVDRERKWFGRLTRLGRFKRGREYARAREKRRESRFPPAGADPPDRT